MGENKVIYEPKIRDRAIVTAPNMRKLTSSRGPIAGCEYTLQTDDQKPKKGPRRPLPDCQLEKNVLDTPQLIFLLLYSGISSLLEPFRVFFPGISFSTRPIAEIPTATLLSSASTQFLVSKSRSIDYFGGLILRSIPPSDPLLNFFFISFLRGGHLHSLCIFR